MKTGRDKNRTDRKFPLLFSIILVFCILGASVVSVSWKTSKEMSQAAVLNLNENLDLIKCTIESIRNKEAEFQKMMAQEIALTDDPKAYITHYRKNDTMVKISLICEGETTGISSTGETFSQEELDFSQGTKVEGLDVSSSYLNYMGAWAYTIRCPVEKDGKRMAELYVEYTFDALDKSLPNGFYNKQAQLYIMDVQTERFVLKPKGMGKRDAGHLNLADFFRANDINDRQLRAEIDQCVQDRKNMMFYHDIRGKSSLNFIWMVNDGSICLVGYVPMEAIQREAKTVNYTIGFVVVIMTAAFLMCCGIYYMNQRQQRKIMREREAEREQHNRELTEALQAARLASSAKTMFLSNMSHDIRTPMNAVIGFTTLLERDAASPDKVRQYTKKIMASGQHLLSLINDILEVSRIESGKVVLNEEEFALNDLISSIDAIVRPMANEKRQEFHIEIRDISHEYLIGDETRMNQILINLLSNAVKYTKEGGDIWLRIIGLKQRFSQFERIRIEVEDNGYGMTPEYLKTIFDVFTRAENSTTNRVQGTGLGMAITKNLVELMGGTIEVFSEPDRGSLFRVDMELCISESEKEKRFWAESGIQGLLCLSENEQESKSIQTMFKNIDVSVEWTADVEKARRSLSENGDAYQIVLLDSSVLEKNGAGVVEKLRMLMPDNTILLITADSGGEMAEKPEQFFGAGYTDILSKPVFASALRDKVQEIQARESGREREAAGQSLSLKGMRFLAAEDNDINAEILQEILEAEGAQCEIAENGRLAYERFAASAEGEFDAILMDVQMPVMNGYEATAAIRAMERGDAGRIPIIAMTANAFAEDEKEALAAGMNIHLAKPIDIELLKRSVVDLAGAERRRKRQGDGY